MVKIDSWEGSLQMADYKNCVCIACRNEFEPDDDIVVCPECGTPYHRDCWNEYGHCINTELHEKGESWKRPNDDSNINKSENERVICLQCGELNQKGSEFCTHCGGKINDNEDINPNMNAAEIPLILDSSDDIDGTSVSDISSFIGKNIPYYLMRFKFFFESKKKFSPNFICLIFPQFWFAYRKMWLGSLIIVLLTFLLGIPGSLRVLAGQVDLILASIQPQLEIFGADAAEIIRNRMLSFSQFIKDNQNTFYVLDTLCSYALLAFRILAFIFGNYIYYRYSLGKIKKIREKNDSLMDVKSCIRLAGGTNIGFIFIAILFQFVLSSILMYIALII